MSEGREGRRAIERVCTGYAHCREPMKRKPTDSTPSVSAVSSELREVLEVKHSQQVRDNDASQSPRLDSGHLESSLANFQPNPAIEVWPQTLDDRFRWSGTKRGLPDKGDLFKLAQVYIAAQRRLWPRLVEARILPENDQEAIARLAGQFATDFLKKRVTPFSWPTDLRHPWSVLGASYVRYSSQQQNPRSLDDQLFLQLERAAKDSVFIPWPYVFGDAGVTGTIANRTGYRLAKDTLSLRGQAAIEILFVDEIARATRDGVETLLLGDLVKELGKRMIGVSDGFDSQDEFSRMKLHFFAMFNEQFIAQHRQKVVRGKAGAFRRGTVIGKFPFGLKGAPLCDATGKPVVGRQGRAVNAYMIDEDLRPFLELLVRRFVDERKSVYKIVREFNQLKVGGRTKWTTSGLLHILTNEIYIGIHITNRDLHVRNANGGIKIIENPRKEWRVRRLRSCQVFPLKRWKQIQARIAETRRGPRAMPSKVSRNTLYPTTLFSGLLFCGYCGTELKLFRSDVKREYRQFRCMRGREMSHGCQLSHSKSVRAVETALLNHVRAEILTPARIGELVKRVNAALAEEAKQPVQDSRPFVKALAATRRKRDRLIELVAEELNPDLNAIRLRIRQFEQEITDLTAKIAQLDAAQRIKVPPVDLQQTLHLLADVRSLLNQDVAAVAPVLRSIFGKIWIKQENATCLIKPWIASFRSHLIPILAERAAKKPDCPDSSSWVNLSRRKWTTEPESSLRIDGPHPVYIERSAEILALARNGASISAIARQYGLAWDTAKACIEYATTGKLRAHKTPRM